MSTIKITGSPKREVVEIDGRLTQVMSLDLHLDGSSLPRLVITPPIFDVDVHLEGDVDLDENTKRTLLALGWTPPQDGEQPDDNAIERWIHSNPKKFEAWVLRYNRIHAGLRELRR